jgi:hypothetical protein
MVVVPEELQAPAIGAIAQPEIPSSKRQATCANCIYVEPDGACDSDAFLKQYLSRQKITMQNVKSGGATVVSLNCQKRISNIDEVGPDEVGARIVQVIVGISIDSGDQNLFYDNAIYQGMKNAFGTEQEVLNAALEGLPGAIDAMSIINILQGGVI